MLADDEGPALWAIAIDSLTLANGYDRDGLHGPSPCEATGTSYILLVVDYFSRFVFEEPL